MIAISEPIFPTENDVHLAQESRRQIGSLTLGSTESVGIQIQDEKISLPAGAFKLLLDVLDGMAEGKALAMVPVEEEISPQEAAELLNVSRPYAAKLYDEGVIPSRRVGTHRRALTKDVLAYKQREKEARLKALDELAAEGQRLNMGY